MYLFIYLYTLNIISDEFCSSRDELIDNDMRFCRFEFEVDSFIYRLKF